MIFAPVPRNVKSKASSPSLSVFGFRLSCACASRSMVSHISVMSSVGNSEILIVFASFNFFSVSMSSEVFPIPYWP